MCGVPLTEITRIPVCRTCLAKPGPLEADYFCASCRTPFLNPFALDEDGRCSLCRAGANGFDAAYTYGSFEGELRELIHLLKYARVRTLAKPLAKLLAAALPLNRSFDVVVPMPMHWRKRWVRGFNQAEVLAKEIARKRGLPLRNAARKRKATAAQAGLTNAARQSNVAGAFEIRHPDALAGKRVLLVDDVMTTGATASACAKALKHAGAREVTLLAVARTDRRAFAPADVAAEPQAFSDSYLYGSLDDAQSRPIA